MGRGTVFASRFVELHRRKHDGRIRFSFREHSKDWLVEMWHEWLRSRDH